LRGRQTTMARRSSQHGAQVLLRGSKSGTPNSCNSGDESEAGHHPKFEIEFLNAGAQAFVFTFG
jgi:hypothetical protein